MNARTPSRRRPLTGLAAATAVTALALLGTASPAGARPLAPTAATTTAADTPTAGPLLSYVVNTSTARGQLRKAERAVVAAGGTVFQTYPQIGVIVARSTNPAFATTLRGMRHSGVQSVGASRTAAIEQSTDDATEVAAPAAATSRTGRTADAPDPMESQQWDMQMIKADQAHAVSLGSRRVLVGVLHSGIDDSHPDLAANFDAKDSVSCIDGGRPDTTTGAWRPTTSDHGTHVAGTIAAAKNGVGIVGVAPNVRLASVKVVDDGGFIYPEYAICGFVWAAEHGVRVTNNSYYIDPWLFWCSDDVDQAAVKTAVGRAVAYATRHRILSVAAAGNDSYDLANKTTDDTSPDDTTPVERPVNNSCIDMPSELPGVVTVSSVDAAKAKSSFSNYGLGAIDVAAPGSRILSTLPGGKYGLKSGTSMASPHVAGVAALLASRYPFAGPTLLTWLLRHQADEQPCPATATTCTGTTSYNAYFGHGIVDALDAVS